MGKWTSNFLKAKEGETIVYLFNGVEVNPLHIVKVLNDYESKVERIGEVATENRKLRAECERLEGVRKELVAKNEELEAKRLELRKILVWAYDLDEYKDNPEERER